MQISPVLPAFLARHLAGPYSPTAELYVLKALRSILCQSDIICLAPTVFKVCDTVIVVRHTLGLERPVECKRLVYVMDDAWYAGLTDTDLPLLYRGRLLLAEAREAGKLIRRADAVVVSSQLLLDEMQRRYPNIDAHLLHPVWPVPVSSEPRLPDAPFRMACLGAWTHRSDIAMILDPVLEALAVQPDARLTLVDSGHLAKQVMEHRQVILVPSMTWPEYLAWLSAQRFDLGLYPLKDTQVNRARSISKLFEYAQTGAAVLASDTWAAASDSMWAGVSMQIKNHPSVWRKAIIDLMTQPHKCKQIFEHAIAVAARAGLQAKADDLWRRLLTHT